MAVGEGLEDSLNLFAALMILTDKMSQYSSTVILVFSLSLDAFLASTTVIPTMVVYNQKYGDCVIHFLSARSN